MTTLTLNQELNGIEISFDSKPAQATIDSLKNAGYRWHRVKKLWYAKNTAERLTLAESIADGKIATAKKVDAVLSLWERCKVDNIPDHNRRLDTKTIAKETREHIKKRFPEIKFSCRIGSGGWASVNEVNFYFKSTPYEKESKYFDAVYSYVKAWLDSYNYDNSDPMTDYFDVNFYEYIGMDNYTQTEPTPAQLEDMKNFDECQKADEERKEAEAHAEFLRQEEERKKATIEYEKQEKIAEKNRLEILDHVIVKDLKGKYVLDAFMICGVGKECNINEILENDKEQQETALIKKEVYFTDETIYKNFCNMFLYDFEFLSGCGGTGTFDPRCDEIENIYNLNTAQRESIKWILWDCVAVYFNNELKLIIDPEGFSYARYVNLVIGDIKTTPAADFEKQENESKKPTLHFPEPIEKQAEVLQDGKQYTIIKKDPWTLTATMQYITLESHKITNYAQYNNALYIEYKEPHKRKTHYNYFYSNNLVMFEGFIEPLPEEKTRRHISGNMYEVLNAGANANQFVIDTIRHYEANGITPIINTLQY